MKGTQICSSTCCGCAACMSICPQSAITMKEDEKGFLYPEVDEKKCVDCGLCKTVCNSEENKNKIKTSYLVKIKDPVQHMLSQSGGAFSAISAAIFDNEGLVFGVAEDENFEAVFGMASNKEELDRMHGSKYMQARVDYTYREIESALLNKKVLFSGTPCQVDALKKYLQKKRVCLDNLYTVDIICHGVPSVLLWRNITKQAYQKVGAIHKAISRDNLYSGWGSNASSFYGIDKYITNDFNNVFYTNLCLRDSCYECKYASTERCGDITIGDAWGVKKNDPDFADSRGVSLMLINSEKGEELFNCFKNRIDWQDADLDKYIQKTMKEPSRPHRSIEEFWHDYFNKDFSYIVKKYGDNNLLLNYKYVIKRGVNAICKRK